MNTEPNNSNIYTNNFIDRYDLSCVKDELVRNIISQYNNEIYPLKTTLQLHKKQISGIGELITDIGLEIDNLKKYNKKIVDYYDEKILLFIYILGVILFIEVINSL